MALVDELMKGAIDTHVHAGPNYIPRSLDVVEAVREACAASQKGIVVKDHHMPSMVAVKLAEKHHADAGFRAFGAITLNNHVGGLNLKAVEVALLMDVKIVWLPTVSAENHYAKRQTAGVHFPKTDVAEQVPEEPIRLLDENGQLKSDVVALLALLAQRPDVVLATGHISAEEIDAVFRQAHALGIKKMVATQPTFMAGASIEQMHAWVALGAYIELSAATSYSGSHHYMTSVERTVAIMQQLGAEHVIISSDFGQRNNPRPVEGMKLWMAELLANGINADALRQMFTINTSRLILDE